MADRVDIDGLEALAKGFVEAKSRNKSGATIVGLFGDLGSGKTTFTKFMAKYLGVEDVVTSPTFVIEKIYKLKDQKFESLIHIDAYRLESGEELENLGWQEIANNPNNLIVIEWPERVKEILPNNITRIDFRFIDEKIREVDI